MRISPSTLYSSLAVLGTFFGTTAMGILLATSAFAQLPSPILSGELTRVSEHVQMITGFPNVIFVTGDDATLVVDTGLGLEQGETVLKAAQSISRGDRLYLTTTHFHPEHAAGEAAFPADTILVRPNRQQEEMARDGQTMLDLFRGFGNFGPLLEGVDSMAIPDITFDDELELDLGGVTVRLMWLGIAHTEGDEMIFVVEDSVLITGDIVQNKVVPTVSSAGGSLTNWLNILNILEQLNADIIVPTHSGVGTGGLIPESRAFITEMRSRALGLKAQGVEVEVASEQLTQEFLRDYPAWAANPDWNNIQGMSGFVQRVYLEAE